MKKYLTLILVVFVILILSFMLNYNINSREVFIGKIPVLEMYKWDIKEKSNLIILQHGFGWDKSSLSDFGRYLALKWFLVVLPDAYAHWDYETTDNKTVLEISVKSAENIDLILNYYKKNTNIDINNYAMLGFSMWGLISFYQAANSNNPPKVICSISSTPKWEELLTTNIAYNSYQNKQVLLVTDDKEKLKIDEYAKKYSPFNKLISKQKTSYFIINGDSDDIVMFQWPQEFNKELQDENLSIFHLIKWMNHWGDNVNIEKIYSEMVDYVEEKIK